MHQGRADTLKTPIKLERDDGFRPRLCDADRRHARRRQRKLRRAQPCNRAGHRQRSRCRHRRPRPRHRRRARRFPGLGRDTDRRTQGGADRNGTGDHGQCRRLQAPAHRRTGQAPRRGRRRGHGRGILADGRREPRPAGHRQRRQRRTVQRDAPRPARCRGRDRAVEFPAAARDVQGRPGAACGELYGPQTLALHPAHDTQIRRAGQGYAAARRAQHRHRRRRAGSMDDEPLRLRQDQLHRIDRDRAPRDGIGGAHAKARDARTRRQRCRDRHARRRCRKGRRGAILGRVPQQWPDLHRDQAHVCTRGHLRAAQGGACRLCEDREGRRRVRTGHADRPDQQ